MATTILLIVKFGVRRCIVSHHWNVSEINISEESLFINMHQETLSDRATHGPAGEIRRFTYRILDCPRECFFPWPLERNTPSDNLAAARERFAVGGSG